MIGVINVILSCIILIMQIKIYRMVLQQRKLIQEQVKAADKIRELDFKKMMQAHSGTAQLNELTTTTK